jgi:hypothetical protein
MNTPLYVPLPVGILIGTMLRYLLMFAVAIPIARACWALALYSGRAKANRARGKGRDAPPPAAENVKPKNSADIFARIHAQSKARATLEGLSADPLYDPLPLGLFMAVDMIVLGVAGFGAGCLGFLFIGLSLKPRSWPGMIALDLGCFIGICLIKP